uniref:Uncharacterized protein n=1 Tax=Anguilla anguilla TaxID=7936 RepID=A0A0E9UFS3_ANGAN
MATLGAACARVPSCNRHISLRPDKAAAMRALTCAKHRLTPKTVGPFYCAL